MGIERFFSSIRDEFNITVNSEYPYKKIKSKYLFIDFNSIIHVLSAHKINLYNLQQKTDKNIFEAELIEHIDNYIINLLKDNCEPSILEYIYICIDGVPTMSKIYEQKKRRYMASLIQYIRNKKNIDKQIFSWDKNNISPGTKFMAKLEEYLNSEKFKNKIFETCKNLKEYKLSGTNEKGEGEMKIINIIKNNKIIDDTIVYSPDSDVIILLMMLNNNNTILRYDQQNTKLDDDFKGHIYNIIEVNKFKQILKKYIDNRKNPYININTDRFINDVILIFIIFGDDFLPKLENFRVSNDIYIILDYYLINYQNNGYLLNDDKSIKKISLIQFFYYLSRNEYLFLERNKMLSEYSNYNKINKDIFGNQIYQLQEMIFELMWKFIYYNRDRYNNQTVNPQNIYKYLTHEDFIDFIKIEPQIYKNINVTDLGKYSNRFFKYGKESVYEKIKDIFINNYINIIKYINIDSFFLNTKKFNNRKILNEYNKLYYLVDSKYNFLNDLFIFTYYNSLQLPFNLTLLKTPPKLNKNNFNSDDIPHKFRLDKLNDKKKFQYQLDYKLDKYYSMLNPVDIFYKDYDKDNYVDHVNKYNNNYMQKDSINEYIKGITWIVKYYFGKNIDNTWYYPFSRTPLLSQIIKSLDNIDINEMKFKSLDLTPLYQILFITPIDVNTINEKDIDFINYKNTEKIINFIKNNKNYYYELNKIYNEIFDGKSKEVDCSTSIFISKCHLHFLEKKINIDNYITDISKYF